MKRITYPFAALLLATSLMTACTKGDNGCSKTAASPTPAVTQAVQTARIANNVAVNALASGWSDQQNCLRNSGDCGWCVTDAMYAGLENQVPVQLSFQSNTRLKIQYMRALEPLDDATIDLQADVALPKAICDVLKVRSASIKAGSYALNMNYEPFGALVVDVAYED